MNPRSSEHGPVMVEWEPVGEASRAMVVTQEQTTPWARGTIWDTSDPYRCRPMQPSSEDDTFRGFQEYSA